MPYLDYDTFLAFLKRYHNTEVERRERMVGADRTSDSGYFGIRRFFGPEAVDPRKVTIEYRDELFQLDNQLVESFARRIEARLRAEGRLYRGPMTAAVAEERLNASSAHVVLQPCDYGLFAGTCFALDLSDEVFAPDGGTLREYARVHCTLLPPGLGVCGLLVTTEPDGARHVLAVKRAAHLASLTGSVGPSAAGSVDFGTQWRTLDEMARDAIAAEIAEELGLVGSEYAVTPLAYAREMFRGNKPQLFCRIDTPLPSAQVLTEIAAVTSRPEFTETVFLPLGPSGRLSRFDVAVLNHEAAMNYYLLEENIRPR